MSNPLFASSALHSLGNCGEYNHVVDALLIPPIHTHADVWRHEASHRISVVFGDSGSGFSVTRELAGISHALILAIAGITASHEIKLAGSTLDDLHVAGPTNALPLDVHEQLESLINRLWQCESWYRMGWRALAPLAELAAIDFAEGVGPAGRQSLIVPNRADWRLRRRRDVPPDERLGLDRLKAQMISEVAAQYPAEFGGYHLRYGSFQNALRKAWNEYNDIPLDDTREELLHLCMVCLLLTPDGRVLAREPLATLFANVDFAKEDPIGAMFAFRTARSEIEKQAEGLTRKVATQLLDGLPREITEVRRLTRAVEVLIRRQQRVGPWQLSGKSGFYWAMENDFDHSFMRFEDTGERQRVVISPAFLVGAASEEELGLIDLPQDWWRTLVLLESLRQTLVTGVRLACPFKGYDLFSFEHDADVQCGAQCGIRVWVGMGKWPSHLDGNEPSLCLIPPQDTTE